MTRVMSESDLVVPVRLSRYGSPSRIAKARRYLTEMRADYHAARSAWYRGDRDLRWHPPLSRHGEPRWRESIASEYRACDAIECREHLIYAAKELRHELSENAAYKTERAAIVESRLRGEAILQRML